MSTAPSGRASDKEIQKTPPPPLHAALVSLDEWQQLRNTREAALQGNPDLAAEYKEIISDMQAEQDKLDAAMIQSDPKVAPIIAKLVELRRRNGAPAPATLGPK